MPEARRDHSLWITLAICLAVVAGAGIGLSALLVDVCDERLAAGLTNVATIGGIVSRLSRSGTAVLTLSGRYTLRIVERFGSGDPLRALRRLLGSSNRLIALCSFGHVGGANVDSLCAGLH